MLQGPAQNHVHVKNYCVYSLSRHKGASIWCGQLQQTWSSYHFQELLGQTLHYVCWDPVKLYPREYIGNHK